MNPRERRMLMILGGVAGLAVVLFLGKSLLGGGGTPIAEPTGIIVPTGQPPSPQPSGPPKLPPLAIFGGRDPFFPLITEGGATSPGPPPSPAPSGSPAPSVSPAPSPQPSGGTNIGGHHVTVLDVFTRDGRKLVQVEVDGEIFTVGEGDTFDGNFKVVSIDDPCATFLFGDEQFTTCEGGHPK